MERTFIVMTIKIEMGEKKGLANNKAWRWFCDDPNIWSCSGHETEDCGAKSSNNWLNNNLAKRFRPTSINFAHSKTEYWIYWSTTVKQNGQHNFTILFSLFMLSSVCVRLMCHESRAISFLDVLTLSLCSWLRCDCSLRTGLSVSRLITSCVRLVCSSILGRLSSYCL